LFNPEKINHFIEVGGYLFLFAIIFAETGLLIGFFLPGDSLLFVAGAFAAVRPGSLNLYVLLVLLCVAAVAGDATGYLLGRRFGRHLFERPNSKLFKREHLVKTEQFYARHGPKTIVLARFVPIVRTFAPTVAGVAGMSYPQFALYNICGGVGWICSMTLLGYFFGNIPILKEHLELLVLGIIVLSILPMVIHWWVERKSTVAQVVSLDTAAPGLEMREEC
jgi:membrane-associated protein